MKQGLFKITENVALTADVYRMVMAGDTSAITAPGQFVNIKLAGKFLRRPISVNDVEGDKLTMVAYADTRDWVEVTEDADQVKAAWWEEIRTHWGE